MDPEVSIINSRRAMEFAIKWMYSVDAELETPYQDNLQSLMNAEEYRQIVGSDLWKRIESYGPKFVENIVQAISRDILCYAMRTLSHCFICGHVHDELIIECSRDVSLDAVCEQMRRTPPWAEGLILRADGYETPFYKKD